MTMIVGRGLEKTVCVRTAARHVVSRAIALFVFAGVVGLCPITAAPIQRATSATEPSTDDTDEVVLSPEQDLQQQLESRPPGTRFRLKAGTYRLTAPLAPKANQTIAGDKDAVLSGARPLTGFVREGSVWFVADQHPGRALGPSGRLDRRAQLCNARVRSTPERLLRQQSKEPLHQIEPRGVGGVK